MVAIFIGYLALTMLLGLWQALRTKSQSDFVLGSSKLPGWMLALSERATGESVARRMPCGLNRASIQPGSASAQPRPPERRHRRRAGPR